jgi:hypothetical protein
VNRMVEGRDPPAPWSNVRESADCASHGARAVGTRTRGSGPVLEANSAAGGQLRPLKRIVRRSELVTALNLYGMTNGISRFLGFGRGAPTAPALRVLAVVGLGQPFQMERGRRAKS